MEANLNKLYDFMLPHVMNFIVAVLIFVVGKMLARIASNIFEKVLTKAKVDVTLATFGRNITYFAMLAYVCIAALNKLGIETNSFIAIIGAAGLAIGLALQGSLSNFAAGVMMIIFHPFKLGDYIEAGGAVGKVHEIQIFSTVIYTDDNKRVIVPNAKITGDKITVHPKK